MPFGGKLSRDCESCRAMKIKVRFLRFTFFRMWNDSVSEGCVLNSHAIYALKLHGEFDQL